MIVTWTSSITTDQTHYAVVLRSSCMILCANVTHSSYKFISVRKDGNRFKLTSIWPSMRTHCATLDEVPSTLRRLYCEVK